MKQLIGKWKIDPADLQAIAEYGDVELEFKQNGELIYAIHEGDKDEISVLTFRLEGDEIITHQPSSPREERTKFFLDSRDKLHVSFGGEMSSYVRQI
jgi:hypothetical protein